MKVNLLNTAHGLVPEYDDDFQEKKKLIVGEVYTVEVQKPRNPEFHRKYFALINCSFDKLNKKQSAFFDNNKETYRKSLELSAGYSTRVFSFPLSEWIDTPRSISLEKMNEDDFLDLYNKVMNIIFTSVLKNLSEEEFRKSLAHF